MRLLQIPFRLLVLAGTAVAVVVTPGLGAIAALPAVGAQGLVVMSGSMEPEIETGSLVVIRHVDPASLQPGEVITFRRKAGGPLTSHRIVERVRVDGRDWFRTKGDNNDAPDPDLAPASGVVGIVVTSAPKVGYALAEAWTPRGRLVLIGLPALVIALRSAATLLRARRGEDDAVVARPRASRGAVALFGMLVVVSIASVVVVAARSPVTHALFRDQAIVSGNEFQSAPAFPTTTAPG